MNTILRIFTIPVLAVSLLTSCKSEPDNKAAMEFGTVRFKEPFVGILKSRPAILEKSLEYPPFSWFVPDTLPVVKTMKVEVNDEFLRGKIDAKFAIVGTDGRPYDGVTFQMGNIPIEDYVFKPTQSDNRIAVTCRVSPSIGDADLKGNVIVSSKGLDLVNGLAASTDETAVMDWHITQKQKVNWPLWLVWLITALLVIALVLLILYFIVKFIIFILKYILSALKSLKDAITKRLKSLQGHSKMKIRINESNIKQKTETEKEKKKREPKEKEEKLHPYLAERQAILLSSASVREKAIALYEAFQFYDYNLRLTPDYRDRQFDLLDPSIQSAFEDLWDKFYKAPNNNGKWSGEEKNSIWIPDDSYVPKNKSYSNIHNKPWWMIKQYYHFSGLRFDKGRAIFKNIADQSVFLYDFEKYIDPNDYSNREKLHEAAFSALSKKLHKKIEDVRKYKEKNIYVWHEDHDCCTLYLVPQEIHGNIDHFGGIGMLKVLRDNGFVS